MKTIFVAGAYVAYHNSLSQLWSLFACRRKVGGKLTNVGDLSIVYQNGAMFRDWQVADLVGLVRGRYGDWDGFGHGAFVAEEVAPKRRLAARAQELLGREALQALMAAWQFEELLARMEQVGRQGNLLFNRAPRRGDLAILYRVRDGGPQAMGLFAQQAQALLYGAGPTPQRLQAFAEYALANHLPNRWPFATYFLFLTQPQAELFVQPQVARWFLQVVGQGQLYEARPSGRLYGALRGYAHGLLEALRPLGARDMVHVQSFLWVCARESRGRVGRLDRRGQVELGLPGVDYVIGAQGQGLHEAQEVEAAAGGYDVGPEAAGAGGEGLEPYSLAQMAQDTGFEEAQLAQWAAAVERKGQAILYGPPGTGKTTVAQGLARHLAGGGDGFVDVVQLHAAYQYEDFVQGLRPAAQEGGGLSYELQAGRFLLFCQEAARREGRCVLVLDEINRANLSRIFGELLYLLEYRDEEMALAGGGVLRVPRNVRLIGTMNTADRSLALLDRALRRRFAFVEVAPDYGVLRRYHERRGTGVDVARLEKLLRALNEEIGDAQAAVGITYFLREDLAETLPEVWRTEIEPALEELFFERPEVVERWRWGVVGGSVMRDA